MAIKEKFIEITLCAANATHFANRGYEIPRSKDKKGRLVIPRGTKLKVKIEDLTESSAAKVTKICDFCGTKVGVMKFDTVMRNRLDDKDSCRSCSLIRAGENKSIIYEDSFEYNYPELVKYWHQDNNKKPSEVSAHSNKVFKFYCEENHVYEVSLDKKSIKCPYCSGRRVCLDNCLITLNPELAKEWHPSLNGELTPFDVTTSYGKTVWWLCKVCGSDWDHTVTSRHNYGIRCPFCSNRKVNHTNCLETTHPELAKQWHPVKNGELTAKDVTYGNGKGVWWLCPKGHEWESTPNNRTNHNSGCPVCSESKGEQRIRVYLDTLNIKYLQQFEFEGLIGTGGGKLSYDFAIIDALNNPLLLIEFDGMHHFKPFGFEKGETCAEPKFKKQKEHDSRKTKYAKDLHIPLLRIKYNQIDEVENIIHYQLSELNLLANV